jgi:hypothetical protein
VCIWYCRKEVLQHKFIARWFLYLHTWSRDTWVLIHSEKEEIDLLVPHYMLGPFLLCSFAVLVNYFVLQIKFNIKFMENCKVFLRYVNEHRPQTDNQVNNWGKPLICIKASSYWWKNHFKLCFSLNFCISFLQKKK